MHFSVQPELKACVGPIVRAIAKWVRVHAVEAVAVAPHGAVGTNDLFSNKSAKNSGAKPRALVGLLLELDHVQIEGRILAGMHCHSKCLDVTGQLQSLGFPWGGDIPPVVAVVVPPIGVAMPRVVAFVGKLNVGKPSTSATTIVNEEPVYESVWRMTDRVETYSVSNRLLLTLAAAVSTSPFFFRVAVARGLAVVTVIPAVVVLAGRACLLAAVPAVKVALGRVIPTVLVAVPVAHPVLVRDTAAPTLRRGRGLKRGRDPRTFDYRHASDHPARGVRLLGGGVRRSGHRAAPILWWGGRPPRGRGLRGVPIVLEDLFVLVALLVPIVPPGGGNHGAPHVPQLLRGLREGVCGEGRPGRLRDEDRAAGLEEGVDVHTDRRGIPVAADARAEGAKVGGAHGAEGEAGHLRGGGRGGGGNAEVER